MVLYMSSANERSNNAGNLNAKSINRNQKIAFICSPRLGDTLIAFVLLNNLFRNGFAVDIYGNFAFDLKDWFPWAAIMPNLDQDKTVSNDQYKSILEKYDVILHMYKSDMSDQIGAWHSSSYILADLPLFRAKMLLVDVQLAICEQIFHLKNLTRSNGLQPLPNLTSHKHAKRVIIHPTSSDKLRSWPAEKFVVLAETLNSRGFQPQFILSPQERATWENLIDPKFYLPAFNSFSETASFIYESAWFIGNDSGIGHLASCLGLPTLSIMLRPNTARQWRPSWSYGEIILPPWWLITRPLKEKFWKKTISSSRVLKRFDLLMKNYSQIQHNENQ